MKFKDSDLTQIYPPHIKPVRVGLYMVSTVFKSTFLKLLANGTPLSPLYWDGRKWRYSKNEIDCYRQDFYWRGLNRDPKLIAKERGE